MPRKCKHEMTGGLTWSGNGWMHGGDDGRMCWKCGARGIESIGPSDETDERVAVEVRAAHIAATLHDTNVPFMKECEEHGWETHANSNETVLRHPIICEREQFHAGYLARVIATHGDE